MHFFNTLGKQGWILFFAVILFLGLSCGKDDDGGPTEPSFISRINISFVESSGASKAFSWQDSDGPGGNDPEVQTIDLSVFTSYDIVLTLEDGGRMDMTNDILAQGVDHLFCYETMGFMPAVTITDIDAAGLPIGLTAETTTAIAGEGSLTLTLKSMPNKSAATPCDSGTLEVEAVFPVMVSQ